MKCLLCNEEIPTRKVFDPESHEKFHQGLCTYAVSNYGRFVPGGKIELTKPIEEIKRLRDRETLKHKERWFQEKKYRNRFK